MQAAALGAMADSDVTLIRDEDLLRRMWQQTDDFSRKKEIRAHMYRLREERLRSLYSPEPSFDVKGNEFTSTSSHMKSFADQSFQSMKSKEVRDAGSPPKDFHCRGQDLKELSNAGWTVESENKKADGSNTQVKEVYATVEGKYDLDNGKGYFEKNKSYREADTVSKNQNQKIHVKENSSGLQIKEQTVQETDEAVEYTTTKNSSSSFSKFEKVITTNRNEIESDQSLFQETAIGASLSEIKNDESNSFSYGKTNDKITSETSSIHGFSNTVSSQNIKSNSNQCISQSKKTSRDMENKYNDIVDKQKLRDSYDFKNQVKTESKTQLMSEFHNIYVDVENAGTDVKNDMDTFESAEGTKYLQSSSDMESKKLLKEDIKISNADKLFIQEKNIEKSFSETDQDSWQKISSKSENSTKILEVPQTSFDHQEIKAQKYESSENKISRECSPTHRAWVSSLRSPTSPTIRNTSSRQTSPSNKSRNSSPSLRNSISPDKKSRSSTSRESSPYKATGLQNNDRSCKKTNKSNKLPVSDLVLTENKSNVSSIEASISTGAIENDFVLKSNSNLSNDYSLHASSDSQEITITNTKSSKLTSPQKNTLTSEELKEDTDELNINIKTSQFKENIHDSETANDDAINNDIHHSDIDKLTYELTIEKAVSDTAKLKNTTTSVQSLNIDKHTRINDRTRKLETPSSSPTRNSKKTEPNHSTISRNEYNDFSPHLNNFLITDVDERKSNRTDTECDIQSTRPISPTKHQIPPKDMLPRKSSLKKPLNVTDNKNSLPESQQSDNGLKETLENNMNTKKSNKNENITKSKPPLERRETYEERCRKILGMINETEKFNETVKSKITEKVISVHNDDATNKENIIKASNFEEKNMEIMSLKSDNLFLDSPGLETEFHKTHDCDSNTNLNQNIKRESSVPIRKNSRLSSPAKIIPHNSTHRQSNSTSSNNKYKEITNNLTRKNTGENILSNSQNSKKSISDFQKDNNSNKISATKNKDFKDSKITKKCSERPESISNVKTSAFKEISQNPNDRALASNTLPKKRTISGNTNNSHFSTKARSLSPKKPHASLESSQTQQASSYERGDCHADDSKPSKENNIENVSTKASHNVNDKNTEEIVSMKSNHSFENTNKNKNTTRIANLKAKKSNENIKLDAAAKARSGNKYIGNEKTTKSNFAALKIGTGKEICIQKGKTHTKQISKDGCPTPVNISDNVGAPRYPDEINEPEEDFKTQSNESLKASNLNNETVEITEQNETDFCSNKAATNNLELSSAIMINNTTELTSDVSLLSVSEKVSKFANKIKKIKDSEKISKTDIGGDRGDRCQYDCLKLVSISDSDTPSKECVENKLKDVKKSEKIAKVDKFSNSLKNNNLFTNKFEEKTVLTMKDSREDAKSKFLDDITINKYHNAVGKANEKLSPEIGETKHKQSNDTIKKVKALFENVSSPSDKPKISDIDKLAKTEKSTQKQKNEHNQASFNDQNNMKLLSNGHVISHIDNSTKSSINLMENKNKLASENTIKDINSSIEKTFIVDNSSNISSQISETVGVSTRRGSGKFGVELRRTSLDKSDRSIVTKQLRNNINQAEYCIEEIFDISLLEQMLENVEDYEQRRRIRAQIRVAKKKFIKTSENFEEHQNSSKQNVSITKRFGSPIRTSKTQPLSSPISDKLDKQPNIESHEIQSETRSLENKKTILKPVHKKAQSPKPGKVNDNTLVSEHNNKQNTNEAGLLLTQDKTSRSIDNHKMPLINKNNKNGISQHEVVNSSTTHLPSTKISSKSNSFHEYANAYLKKVKSNEIGNIKVVAKPSHNKQTSKTVSVTDENQITASHNHIPNTHEKESSNVLRRSKSPEKKQICVSKITEPKDRLYQRSPSPDFKKKNINEAVKENIAKSSRSNEHSTKLLEDDKPAWVTNRNLKKITTESRSFSNKKIEVDKKQRATSPSKIISKPLDVITSSYGPGPLDVDGKPLFGIKALRKGASNIQVQGTIVQQEYSRVGGAEPVGTTSLTTVTANAEDLEKLLAVRDRPPRLHGLRGLAAITVTKKFGDKNTSSDDHKEYQPTSESFVKNECKMATQEVQEPLFQSKKTYLESAKIVDNAKSHKSETKEVKGTKIQSISEKKQTVRQNSVKSLTEKFIKNSRDSIKKERSAASYPKAGLILRTRRSSDAASDTSQQGVTRSNSDQSLNSVEGGSTTTAYHVTTTGHQVVTNGQGTVSRGHQVVTSVSQKVTSHQAASNSSFLDSKTKVTGVQDILRRMKNADIVVEEGDTAQDAEARSLLNKFLGASVLMAGMKGLQPPTPNSQAIANADADRRAIQGDINIEECWDEQLLRDLLEQSTDYEQRRRVRARIRALMAEQEACANAVTEALNAALDGEERANGANGDADTREEEEEVKRVSTGARLGSGTATAVTKSSTESTGTRTTPTPTSPFSKFRQLEKQNSTTSPNSPQSPKGPQSPGSLGQPYFKFTDPALQLSAVTIKERLLQWCRDKTRGYENVKLENFSSSWADGLAFCALIHHFLPDAFDFSKLTPADRRHNFTLAFKVADEKAGIYPLLDVEDMVSMRRPDWKCVFTYVQAIHRRFRDHH